MDQHIPPEVQVAIAAAVYETLRADAVAEQEAATTTATDATSVREVCTAIGDVLYELLSSRDAQGRLSLKGGNQRSPWASKALTLRRYPGQN